MEKSTELEQTLTNVKKAIAFYQHYMVNGRFLKDVQVDRALMESDPAGNQALCLHAVQEFPTDQFKAITVNDKEFKCNEALSLKDADSEHPECGKEQFNYYFGGSSQDLFVYDNPEMEEEIRTAVRVNRKITLRFSVEWSLKQLLDWYKENSWRIRSLPFRTPDVPLLDNNPISLSDEETDAIRTALNSSLCFIDGTGGNGKTTHILTTCILAYLLAGKRILVVTKTDNNHRTIMDSLLTAMKELKIHPYGTVFSANSFEGNMHYDKEYKGELPSPRVLLKENRYNPRIIIVTMGRYLSCGFGSRMDHVFLDEATNCNVIEALALTIWGAPITMFGNSRLLNIKYVPEDILRDKAGCETMHLFEMTAPYLESLLRWGAEPEFYRKPEGPFFRTTVVKELKDMYYFSPAIGRILSKHWEDRKLLGKAENGLKIMYINVPHTGTGSSVLPMTRISDTEKNAICELLRHNGLLPSFQVGILTPYKNQCIGITDALLDEYCLTENSNYTRTVIKNNVLHIHRAVFRKWDVVIFSVTEAFKRAYLTRTGQNSPALEVLTTLLNCTNKLLILVGDVNSWRNKPAQFLTDLFSVAEEADTKLDIRSLGISLEQNPEAYKGA